MPKKFSGQGSYKLKVDKLKGYNVAVGFLTFELSNAFNSFES